MLVRNIPGFAVSVIPVDLPHIREGELSQRLGSLLDVSSESVGEAIRAQRIRNPYEPVRISMTPVPREVALAVTERAELFPGVRVDPESIRFYVDGSLYETRTPADLKAGQTWVFDHPFFMLINVAVGGDWPGSPDATSVFPQTMLVDYVRVYR